jgi:hypothetical protein
MTTLAQHDLRKDPGILAGRRNITKSTLVCTPRCCRTQNSAWRFDQVWSRYQSSQIPCGASVSTAFNSLTGNACREKRHSEFAYPIVVIALWLGGLPPVSIPGAAVAANTIFPAPRLLPPAAQPSRTAGKVTRPLPHKHELYLSSIYRREDFIF